MIEAPIFTFRGIDVITEMDIADFTGSDVTTLRRVRGRFASCFIDQCFRLTNEEVAEVVKITGNTPKDSPWVYTREGALELVLRLGKNPVAKEIRQKIMADILARR